MIMIPAIIVSGHLAVAVADRPPVVNFEQTCREETAGDKRIKDTFELCVADEKHARDQLVAQWSSFDPAARASCVRTSTSGHTPSYLELLVCLELDQADREVRGRTSTGIIAEPGRPASERDETTDPSRAGPAAPSRSAPVAAPSRPAAIPRSPQQPVARSAAAPTTAPPAAAPPAASPAAEPLPLSPPPAMEAPQPPSQGEVLQQSFCRSPLGYVLPSCR
jgi:hypothetical protein